MMIEKLFVLMMVLYIGPNDVTINKIEEYVSMDQCMEKAQEAAESYQRYMDKNGGPSALFDCVVVDVPESY